MSNPVFKEDLVAIAEIREYFKKYNLSKQDRERVLRYLCDCEDLDWVPKAREETSDA